MTKRQIRHRYYMSMDFSSSDIVSEICRLSDDMYAHGWNERNGGNISRFVSEEELRPYESELEPKRKIELTTPFPALAGKSFLITGTLKYIRNVSRSPKTTLGLMRICEGGREADLLWGFEDGGRPTSETTMHLGAYLERSAIDSRQKYVIHCHPASVILLSEILPCDDKIISQALWKVMNECIVIFPEGVGALDWMISSSDGIGIESAPKFRDFRALIWAMHGITAVGDTADEAYGLIECIDKAADIYVRLMSVDTGYRRLLTPDELRMIVKSFGLNVREDWLE